MKIIFGSDVTFNYFLDKYPGDESAVKAMAEVKAYFKTADFSVINLESVVGNKSESTPIVKDGPNLMFKKEFMKYIEEISPSAVGLANNHTGDFGFEPIFDTINALKERGIAHFGAGANVKEAYKPALFEKDDIKVAVIGFCENEFGTATESAPGSAGYSLGRVTAEIKKAQKNGYLPVVYFHGGNEQNPFPSPKKVELYRHFVDIGAKAVICAHTHCPQGYEVYEGAPIVYSMGNFFFPAGDYSWGPRDKAWYYGYLSELDITGKKVDIKVVPYRQSFEGLKILDGEELEEIKKYLDVICAPIKDSAFIQRYFNAWCKRSTLIKALRYEDKMSEDTSLCVVPKNILNCESHNEVVTTHLRIICEQDKYSYEKEISNILKLKNMEIPEEL